METRIRKLSEDVVNQIAAGEVVENPASVIKELVENSLDAGATRIEITCNKGGFELIRIEDDGCGMSREDALMSLERYATSKMIKGEDLFRLVTMGFRGEALAAIAAISHLEMKTSLETEGTHLIAFAGKIQDVKPVARNRGTTLEIRSLFYNVPARKKFQKSIAASNGQIYRVIEKVSLAYPEISFSLVCDGKVIFTVEPEDKKERIERLLGPFVHMSLDPKMWGLFGAPQEAKSHRRNQYLFINRRPIFSPLISRAIKEGYGTRIKENEHPCFVLFLDIPPDQVDVNVHPQKKEARLCEEEAWFRKIRQMAVDLFEKQRTHVFAEPVHFESPSTWNFAEQSLPEVPEKREPLFIPISFPEKILGVFGTYVLLEKEELIVVDLQAAERRIAFETNQKGQISSHYTLEEAEVLWKELQNCRDLRYDPSGRVIWKKIEKKDWEKILN